METPRARIRPYQAEDEKQVRFMVGQAQMEPLAFANNRAYFHPVTLAIWIAVSSIFAQYMKWWPDPSQGFLGYLLVLPAFFAPAVPIMFFIDWRNRPDIEERAEKVLRRPDLYDISAYYSRSPASGFWILEYNGKLIGLIALDASLDASSDLVAQPVSEQQLKKLLHAKGTSPVATIRHFFVEEAYRPVAVEEDLLQYAVRVAFETGKTIREIRILGSPLRPTVEECLRSNGFTIGENVAKLGILGWGINWYKLDRKKWEAEPVADDHLAIQSERLQIFDRTGCVPGYDDDWSDPRETILEAVKTAPSGPLSVIIDSADTLCADIGSPAQTYTLISAILTLLRARPSHSRLIVHILTPTSLLPLLLPTRLSPTLAHLTAHPPSLLTHLSTTQFTPPPPSTPAPRFWAVFSPLASRAWEVERLVFGVEGEGAGSGRDELVVEVLLRGPGSGTGEGKRRGAERVLEGWTKATGPCELVELESLKNVWARKALNEAAPDPTQNLSFNLNLTPEQQQSRASVPLPYVHDGKVSENTPASSAGAIFYDPDSADDIDDDDPDEDLDI
ncbi:hypothetical protein EW146_g3947 [Bondarzewia mesenterica]|uniref:Elongator complex protein 5 n=1 Tax=Bondarzewia mesenterica TaxID=1095465 RepID=A0A4V3XF98_9AGAM|nr:hypothetical protein EW146_g3947 [Bondarzewia mesenterica]